MKITIDDNICNKMGLPFPKLLLLLFIKTGANLEETIKEMKEEEMIVEVETLFKHEFCLTNRWDDISSDILLTSDSSVPDDTVLDSLTEELMKIFPPGKKEGTSIYWKGNRKDIKLRLKKFFKLYGANYSNEEILDAAKRYVESFNGKYSYMKVLKYFIWKDVRKIGENGEGYIEETSDLASFLENKEQEDINNNWTAELR